MQALSVALRKHLQIKMLNLLIDVTFYLQHVLELVVFNVLIKKENEYIRDRRLKGLGVKDGDDPCLAVIITDFTRTW